MNKYVIVAGAGISIASPSNLPSWWEYNKNLINTIKEQALSLCPESYKLLELIDIEKSLPVQCVSDIIVNQCAGTSYFPLLEMLNSANPNANHFAIAEMARQGNLKAIVTTNFDTLIETAFRNNVIPLSVIVQEKSYVEVPQIPECCLLKIHGSVSDYDSLIDTVTQKSVGLSPIKRLVLNGVFSDSKIIFMGFSGADLDFDIDYIPIAEAIKNGAKVIWIVRTYSSMNPNVKKLKETYPDSFKVIECDLSNFFKSLGVDYYKINAELSVMENDDTSVQIKDKMIRRMREVFSEPHIGAHGCIGICINLLDMIGEYNAASELANIYEAKLDPTGIDIFSISGVSALGLQKLRDGKVDEAKHWFLTEYKALQKMKELAQSIKDSNFSNDMIEKEHELNLASCLSNLGLIYLNEGNPREAIKYFKLAKAAAENIGNIRMLSIIKFNLARTAYHMDNDTDKYLDALQTCANYAKIAGNMTTLVEIIEEDCKQRLKLGEYFLAQERLNECETYLKNISSIDLHFAFFVLKAEYLLRIGECKQSLKCIKDLSYKIEAKSSKKWAKLILKLILTMYDCNEVDCNLIDILCAVCEIEALNFRHIFEQQSKIIKNQKLCLPLLVIESLPESNERKNVVYYEYVKDRNRIPETFSILCNKYIEKQLWSRLLDTAKCLYNAATTEAQQSEALYHMGCAKVEIGEDPDAIQYFNEVILLGDNAKSLYLAWSYIELAKIYITKNDKDAAEQYYNSANYVLDKKESPKTLVSACMAYVRKLTDLSRWEEAEVCVVKLLNTVKDTKEVEPIRYALKSIRRNKAKIKPDGEIDMETAAPEIIATEALRLYNSVLHREKAWQLMWLAKEKYNANGNRAGVGKCENNMGGLCIEEGKLDEAASHFSTAMNIKFELNDFGGGIAQLATIISIFLENKNTEKAGQYVNYAEMHMPEYKNYWEKYCLFYEMFLYYCSQGKIAQSFHYAKLAQNGIAYLHRMNISDNMKEGMLCFIRSTEKYFRRSSSSANLNEFEQKLVEANRLFKTGNFNKGYTLLKGLKEDVGNDLLKLGQIEGSLGNAYLNTKNYQKAIDSFNESLCLFSQVESKGEKNEVKLFSFNATNGITIALDNLGRGDESLAMLQKIISENKTYDKMGFALRISYCNRLFANRHNLIKKGNDIYNEVINILNNLKKIQELTHEELGTIYHTYGILYFIVSDYIEAKNYLDLSRNEFVICNSPKLEATEIMIKQIP